MIEAFLFDLGNVLLHFSHERMCRQIAELCGLTPVEIRRLFFESGIQQDVERGKLTEQELHSLLERTAGRSLDFDALVEAASDIFAPNTDIFPVIDSLRSQGRRLVILSNTSVSHFRYVRQKFEQLARFDDYVLSYEVGEMKPADAIFQAAIAAAGCAPDRCFYTDDIADYVVAARRHGLRAEIFTSVPTLVAHLRGLGVELPGIA
ncbi:MAG TPA: HAD-IA family hydrolase [Planctomycetaceae bacterium]|jgi:putative hydrolase of the HAD superfamily|nr:HAD-IA family hydrolase [Planctomycetaceae bacterium]